MLNHDPFILITYRVETDDTIKGEYPSLERAEANATPEDYIVEVRYKEVRNTTIRTPEIVFRAEMKKGDWLLISSDDVKDFVIDASEMTFTPKQRKDLLSCKEKIYDSYLDYMPFRSVDDIISIVLHKGKYGVRKTGGSDVTPWTMFNTVKETRRYAEKTWNLKVD